VPVDAGRLRAEQMAHLKKHADPTPSVAGTDGLPDEAVSLLASIPAAVFLLDAQQRILFANALALELFGYAQIELLDRPVEMLVEGGLPDASQSRRRDSGEIWTAASLRLTGLAKDGARLSLAINPSPFDVGGRNWTICIVRDVSGQQDGSEAHIRERLNEAQRIAKIGSWTWNADGDRHWWSDELYRMLELDPRTETRPFDRFMELVHPHDRQRLLDASASALAGNRMGATDVRVVFPDGRQRIFQTQGEVSFDAHGNATRMHGTLQDITERKTTQTALHLSDMRYREAQRIAKLGSWEWNIATNASWWSEELYRILEEDPRDYAPTFDNFLAKLHPDDRQTILEHSRTMPAIGESMRRESRLLLSDGRQRVIEQLLQVRPDEHNQAVAIVGTIHDVTERRALESQLRESEARYASTVQLAAVGITHVEMDGGFSWSNQRLQEMLGYSAEELEKLTIWAVSHPEDAHVTDQERARLDAGEIDTLRTEKRYLRKDGTVVWVRITSSLRRAADGNPLYHVSVVEDITAQKTAQERVQYLATHDELTGLANRTLFAQLLDRAIQAAERHNRHCAVLFVDLDRFKIINDSLGHDAGDLLLKEIAARLTHCVRRVDVVARLGGDEFVVLLDQISDPSAAAEVAKKVLSSVLAPVHVHGHECRITASIGVAIYPLHAHDAPVLLKNADVAMYLAKEEGKNNFQLYSPQSSPMSVEHLVLEAHLARALEREEFSLQYQPRVNLATGAVTGAEALLRWWNPALGTVPPAQFIPLAETTGLIVSIGRWVLKAACEQNAAWQRRGAPNVVVSVNLSPRQFRDPTLVADIADVLRETGLAPELLELEITESMIMHNVEMAAGKAAAIKRLGVRLAIDDFGTGYSSLAQLKRFPIDTLKVDRSFVRDIPGDADDRVITEAIVSLGKALGVTVVAEGVETEEQLAFLRTLGCDEMQGFLVRKPCHPDAVEELFTSPSGVRTRKT
jgi:diguanylate cyclase (GGDEF)-like protein/PAS domain S-box-containing protein